MFNSTSVMSFVELIPENGSDYYSAFMFQAFLLSSNQNDRVLWVHCDVTLNYCTDSCATSRLGLNHGEKILRAQHVLNDKFQSQLNSKYAADMDILYASDYAGSIV